MFAAVPAAAILALAAVNAAIFYTSDVRPIPEQIASGPLQAVPEAASCSPTLVSPQPSEETATDTEKRAIWRLWYRFTSRFDNSGIQLVNQAKPEWYVPFRIQRAEAQINTKVTISCIDNDDKCVTVHKRDLV